MKGLILAGGKGTRLLPATKIMNKHMVPILNVPMIVYPLETLKQLKITDIMVISGGEHIGGIAEFLGDGSDFGVNLTYRVQKEAGGIAQALGLAKDFAEGEGVAVILGDNIFDNKGIFSFWNNENDAILYIKKVPDPTRFGILRVSVEKMGYTIIEKPATAKDDDRAITGLYVYPPDVFDVISTITPSARGELEITDVNNYYISNNRCVMTELTSFWSDAGTPDSLFEVIEWVHNNK